MCGVGRALTPGGEEGDRSCIALRWGWGMGEGLVWIDLDWFGVVRMWMAFT